MGDTYANLVNTPVGRVLAKRIGLPAPPRLQRYEPGSPPIDGPVLLGGAPGGTLVTSTAGVLASIQAETHTALEPSLREAAAAAGLDAKVFNPDAASPEQTFKALVFDATGIVATDQLEHAYAFFHGAIRRIRGSGRIVVLATTPARAATQREAVAQRALEGLVRSIGKEVKRGATAQLLHVEPWAGDQLESTLRFLLSPRSAYVSGQVIRIAASDHHPGQQFDWQRPLDGKVALVTGAARGIGSEVARVLARDGAHVVALDVPSQAATLAQTVATIGGSELAVDVTAPEAAAAIADHLLERHGGVDIVVHNAGVTRDKTLGRMTPEQWELVLAVNLTSQERINDALFERSVVRPQGRIVTVSSISGIAGNAGQTNYATSKAGVIGLVEAYAPALFERGHTLNAVAPGFIETQMTAAMPFAIREAGRRMNSLSQGGLPVDVAETIAWLASPASAGVTGNVVRVCGQSLLGA
jgi:3-oxoacyl-[acyl-carrier protein] reductase